jgi:hypothetical protein
MFGQPYFGQGNRHGAGFPGCHVGDENFELYRLVPPAKDV